jgi:glutathione-regulated potassium-efflux system ancillary protein KefF
VITVVYAHPYPGRSRANAALLRAIRDLPGLQVRSLYDLYPDFDIDGDAERNALESSRLVAFMHPLYWYTTTALLKHWFDHVLVRGWAYGKGATGLRGKDCLWIVTAGGDADAFDEGGRHGQPFSAFVPVVEQTARYCGMNWLEPFLLEGAHEIPDAELEAAAQRLRERLGAYIAGMPSHA